MAQCPPDAPPVSDSQVLGAPFPDALKTQLGPKLIWQTDAVEVFLVGDVEKPSENQRAELEGLDRAFSPQFPRIAHLGLCPGLVWKRSVGPESMSKLQMGDTRWASGET